MFEVKLKSHSSLYPYMQDYIGKHGQTDPVRTVQIDPFKTA